MINIKFFTLDSNDNLLFSKMSYNDIDDDESTSAFSSEISSSNKQQKTSGRPFNPVWDHFNQIEKKKGRHYSASCKYCPEK